MPRTAVIGLYLLLAAPTALAGQTLSQSFSRLFTFGDCGEPLCLSVDVAGPHGDHYIPGVTQGENDLLAFITGSIANSLASLPFAAASGGVSLRFVDGAPVATAVSTGSIFGERSQTLGRGSLLVGANVNSLRMRTIRGVPLRDLTFRFAHQNVGSPMMGDPIFENDIIEVTARINLNILVTSIFASYGLHDDIDVGILLPIVHTSLSGASEAQVIPFQRPTPHLFGTAGNPSEFADAASSASAAGPGDIALRVKANLHQADALGFAVTADVRLPTGDSDDFLGSGQTSLRLLGVGSARVGSFSPHLNAGFAYRTGSRQNHSIIAAAGFDQLLDAGVTFALDFLADLPLGESPLQLPDRVVLDTPARRRVRLTDIPDEADRIFDGSIGLKIDLPSDFRFITNLLVPLSDGGLRPRFLATVGLERSS